MYKVDEILREVEEFPMDSIEERWLFLCGSSVLVLI